jgi:hypothetical protein
MPPSRIPEAQVQAILAELRESGAYPDMTPAPEVSAPQAGAKPHAGMVAAVIASALALGLVFSPLSDLVWSRREAPPPAARAPLAPPPAPTPAPVRVAPVEAAPIAAVVERTKLATPAPAKRANASRSATTTRSRPKSRCLSGGACGKADVAAAERRVRAAYASASKAGVSRTQLATAKSRWEVQRRRSAKNPRTSVRNMRALAVELNRKAAAARARD